ncbi:phosphoketolase family protein [Thiobacillus sp.]
MKATKLIVQCLENEGVEYIFGVPGKENMDLLDALLGSSIRFVMTRHEQGAAFMADVYGRLTGKAGVCLATLGPGATNLITGVADANMDRAPVTRDKPVIFAYHAYPWLIHRLTYRRINHHNIHVRGYKEEGTITTPFDMTVLNDLDRFHLVMDTIDRLPQTGDKGIYLKQQLKDKLVEHKQYINKHGDDMPEIRNWKWGKV